MMNSLPFRIAWRLRSLHPGPYPALCATAILAVTILSCDTPGIRLVYPDVPSDGSSGVTFQVTLEDSALAETLGWSNGVPEATVYLQRVGEPFAPESLTTDSFGQARLSDILPGQFKVAAYRVLAESETGPTSGVVRAFGDGWIRDVYRGATIPMTLMADHAGSLVFSEWYVGSETIHYSYSAAHYLELYNNSDTTVYLDGMLLGSVVGTVVDISDTPELSCSATESWRNDPLGVWSAGMHQFPGSGHDYPVVPGQSVVVARDAVDHSVACYGLPDLSSADFEFEGAADVDNPDVPNMPFLGPERAWSDLSGLAIAPTMFLALPTELELLERRRSFRGHDYVRVPTERLLDVVRIVAEFVYTTYRLTPPCGISVPRCLERLEGGGWSTWYDPSMAAHRRILRVSAQGRLVLQDVNTSFLDFVHSTRSPASVEW